MRGREEVGGEAATFQKCTSKSKKETILLEFQCIHYYGVDTKLGSDRHLVPTVPFVRFVPQLEIKKAQSRKVESP